MVFEIIQKSGNILDSDKLWMSYKYNSVKSNFLTNLINNRNKTLNFSSYYLNRTNNCFIFDINSESSLPQIMKQKNQECPFRFKFTKIYGMFMFNL